MKSSRAFTCLTACGVLALSILAAGAGTIASAGPIVWGSAQNISGDSDVSTTGTLVYAYNFGPNVMVSTTVNGVTFARFVVPDFQKSATVDSVTISESPDDLLAYSVGSGTTPFANLSNSYKDLLNSAGSAGQAGTVTLQLGGLTSGQTYDFQWWSNNSTYLDNWSHTTAANGNAVSLNANTSGSEGGLGPGIEGGIGQYAIGRFTADSTSYSITFDGVNGQPLINGFQLRAISVPEPSTCAIALAGLACGGFSMWRRRRRARSGLVAGMAFLVAVMAVPVSAATYTWGNLTPNGNLTNNSGYSLATPSNWADSVAPTFDSQAELVFTGLDSGTATTIYGGSAATTMNRITVSTASILRFNSGNSTFSFQGTSPTIDVQNGTLRLEVDVSTGTAGLTKTGAGVLFSNLQSVTAGFTAPFTIAQGSVASGNNFALGDAKTVNILAGAAADMSGQSWGSANIATEVSATRKYTFNISGTGSGLGAIYNSAGDVSGAFSGINNLNLNDDASVGGTGIFAIAAFAGGKVTGNGNTLTKVGTNEIWIGGTSTNVPYRVDQGTLVGYLVDAAFGGAAGSVSVGDGATLANYGNRSFANSLSFDDGSTLTNKSGTATWSGNATLTGGTTTVTGGSASTPITMSGVVSGSGGITKTGANTLTLSNTNTYTGVTFISSGTVRLAPTGSIADSSTIRVASGASLDVSPVADYVLAAQILTGDGTVVGDVSFSDGSTVRPGNSPGTLTVTGTVVWNPGGNYDWQVLNATGTAGVVDGWDLLTVGGALDLTGLSSTNRFNINLWSLSATGPDVNGSALNFNPNVSGSWTILTAAGGITGFSADRFQVNVGPFNGTGGFANALASGWGFSMQQAGNNLNVVYSFSAVPEPTTIAMAFAGLAGGGYMVRRRRKRA